MTETPMTQAPAKKLVWHGELVSRPRLLFRGSLLVAAPLLWLTLFLILPSILLLALAFATRGPSSEVLFFQRDDAGRLQWLLTFDNFRRLLEPDILEDTRVYFWILLRTLWLAASSTALCMALAYPISFFIAARSPRTRAFWLLLLIIPFGTNLVVRTTGWQVLLAANQPAARLAAALGLIDPGTGLYPSAFAVYLGMITASLPFAVLPLYTNVERLDWSIVEAARDLYASPIRTFRHGILPQTYPGLTVAVILTFIPDLGMFVVPDLLGGAKVMLAGNLIQQQFYASTNYPFGAAISFGLMALTLLGLWLFRRFAREATLV